jgi:hypothetical protein
MSNASNAIDTVRERLLVADHKWLIDLYETNLAWNAPTVLALLIEVNGDVMSLIDLRNKWRPMTSHWGNDMGVEFLAFVRAHKEGLV